jgi:EF hand
VRSAPGDRGATCLCRLTLAGAALLAFAGCSGAGGNPDTADSATCDHGFLCGSYVDGDGDGNVSQGEWDNAFHAADTNGDGQLSQGEFQGGGGNWGGGRGGR